MALVSTALLALGTLVVAASCVGAVLARDSLSSLHYLAPTTSLGAPLIGAAAALDAGAQWSTAWILFITAVLAATGPVAQAAIGRAAVEEEDR